MLIHRYKSHVLVLAALALAPACSSLQPSHYGKFTFQGVVKDTAGKPVPNAWVKVRGWETLTDAQGRWKQEQIVHCGALREDMSGKDSADAILVTAKGYEPFEEKFVVKHPAWFNSCEPETTIAFDAVMQSETKERKENREADKFKPRPETEIPWPEEPKKGRPRGTSL